MSIDDPRTVDVVATRDGAVVLVLTDHRDWSQPLEHLHALQEKLNTYAALVETGKVWQEASAVARRPIAPGSTRIEVRIALLHSPPGVFFEFLQRAGEVLAPLGIDVTHDVRPPDDSSIW